MATFLAVIELIRKIIDLGEKLGRVVKDGAVSAWVNDLHSTIDSLEKAKTLEEKVNAARRLSDLTRRIG